MRTLARLKHPSSRIAHATQLSVGLERFSLQLLQNATADIHLTPVYIHFLQTHSSAKETHKSGFIERKLRCVSGIWIRRFILLSRSREGLFTCFWLETFHTILTHSSHSSALLNKAPLLVNHQTIHPTIASILTAISHLRSPRTDISISYSAQRAVFRAFIPFFVTSLTAPIQR